MARLAFVQALGNLHLVLTLVGLMLLVLIAELRSLLFQFLGSKA